MADTNLQVFNSEEFGNVRTVIVNNDPMFCLIDVCRALEIGNVSQLKTRLNQGGVIIKVRFDIQEYKTQIHCRCA